MEILKKKLSFTLNGDSLGELTNGEKLEFVEKVKLFFKVAFSEKMLLDMARDLERESLAREAAADEEREAKQRQKQTGLADLLKSGLCV